MKTPSTPLIPSILLGCAAVAGAQGESAPPGLFVELRSSTAQVFPYESIELQVHAASATAEAWIDPILFSGSTESHYLELWKPGAETAVRLRAVQGRGALAEGSPEDVGFVHLLPGAQHDFRLVAGFDFAGRKPLFEEVGTYRLAAVIDGAVSNTLQIACLPAPASHMAVIDTLERLRERRLLDVVYNPHYTFWPHYREALVDVEALARQDRAAGIAAMTRIVLARAALIEAEADDDAERIRSLSASATAWLETVPDDSPLIRSVRLARREAADVLKAERSSAR